MAQRRRSERRKQEAPQPVAPVDTSRRRKPPSGPRKLSPLFFIISGLLVVVIIVVLVVNYVVSVKRPGDQPILQVNNKTFTWRYYVDILKSQKLGSDALGGQFNPGVAPYQLMQTLAENELIRQAALREGLKVTDEEIKQEMMNRLLDPKPSPDTPKSQVEREFQVKLSNYLKITQLPRGTYEDIVYLDLLRDQLRNKLGANLPRVQPHAFVNQIVVGDQTQVEAIQKRLKTEEFSKVARTASVDEETAKEGGAIGWTPRLVINDLDTLFFGLELNHLSDPISAKEGVYIIRITQRTGDKARIQAILAKDFASAQEAKRRVENGTPFETVAAEVATDPQLRAGRGDLGLIGPGDRGGIFDLYIAGIPLNTITEPVNRINQTVFYMISQRTQALEVSEKNLEVLKTRALEAWLRREWDSGRINYCPKSPDDCFSNLDVDKALGEIGDVSRTKFEDSATATAQARQRGSQSPF